MHFIFPKFPIVFKFIFLIWQRERERERERERDWFVVPFIYAFIGFFLYVPWPGIEPTTLAHWDNTVTHWAACPGLSCCWIICISCFPCDCIYRNICNRYVCIYFQVRRLYLGLVLVWRCVVSCCGVSVALWRIRMQIFLQICVLLICSSGQTFFVSFFEHYHSQSGHFKFNKIHIIFSFMDYAFCVMCENCQTVSQVEFFPRLSWIVESIKF